MFCNCAYFHDNWKLYYHKMKTLKHIAERINFHLTNNRKPLTIHTEAIFIDDVWESVKKKALDGSVLKWYVMTPANYDYFKVSFNTKYSKKQLSKIMSERYNWLLNNEQHLELHIHFNKIMNITYEEQEKLIKESIQWFKKELGFKPKEFVSGWYAYNKETIKLLKKYNLKLIHQNKYKEKHDYNG